MQSVIYSKVSKEDVKSLFGVGEQIFAKWVSAGLCCEADGRFLLLKTCRWVEKYHREIEQQRFDSDGLSQQQLVSLLGLSRQRISVLGKFRGLPRNADGSYDLGKVVQWLRGYYQGIYEREYKKQIENLKHRVSKKSRQISKLCEGK